MSPRSHTKVSQKQKNHSPLVAFRAQQQQVAWLHARADADGRNVSAILRSLIDDAMRGELNAHALIDNFDWMEEEENEVCENH